MMSPLLVLLFACADDPPPAAPKDVPIVIGTAPPKPEGHAAVAPGSFEATQFKCCDKAEVVALAGAYSALGERLAADDAAGSTTAAAAFAAAVAPVKGLAGLPAEDGPELEKLAALGDGAGKDIAALRALYLSATPSMLALAGRHQGGEQTFAVAYCPMKPGRWLQTQGKLANPYYGKEMLTCGTFEKLGS
jgi:hypothetical protein